MKLEPLAFAPLAILVLAACSAKSTSSESTPHDPDPTGTGGAPAGTGGAGGTAPLSMGGTINLGGVSSTNGGATTAGGSATTGSGGTAVGAGGTTGVAGALPGTGGSVITITPGAGSAGEESCGIQSFDLERKPTEVLLVLDRSASMQDPPDGVDTDMQKWELTAPAVIGVVQETDSGISWGLKLFPEGQDTGACDAETIVDTIHVPIAPMNAANVVAAIQATQPEGDGTPTGDAIDAGVAYLQTRMNDNPKYILLATDGEPSCAGVDNEGQDDARPYAIDAITRALAAGFPTFVVGVNTTKDSATDTLNAMAMAGGVPRPPDSVNPLAMNLAFYLANTQAELADALRAITGEIASCVFPLNPPPPVPDNIAVDVNSMRSPQDPARADGWEYTSDDHTGLEVYGSWCDLIKGAGQNQVQILYGCPNEPIPPPR